MFLSYLSLPSLSLPNINASSQIYLNDKYTQSLASNLIRQRFACQTPYIVSQVESTQQPVQAFNEKQTKLCDGLLTLQSKTSLRMDIQCTNWIKTRLLMLLKDPHVIIICCNWPLIKPCELRPGQGEQHTLHKWNGNHLYILLEFYRKL